jgi:hypothetical protein
MMTNPFRSWDLPVDPDTDAAGDRGYGDTGLQETTLPDQDQGDNSSETEFDVHDPEYDDGDYVGTDSDQWNQLGFDLPEDD